MGKHGKGGVKTPSGKLIHLKTSFDVEDKLEAFYTGGNVQFSGDEEHLFCMCGSAVKVLSVETGRVAHSIEEEEDTVTCFAVSPDNKLMVIAWRSLLLKQYDWRTEQCTRTWKGHLGPVVCMTFDPTSTLLATGSGDSSVKVWDCVQQYCTHNLRGSRGMVSLVQFHPDPRELRLFTSSVDCTVRVWNLETSRCVQILEGHVSAVTSLGFVPNRTTLLSGGRDKVVHVWDLASGSLQKTLPVFEAVEGLVVLPEEQGSRKKTRKPEESVIFATAGDKGVIRLWDASTGRTVHTLEPLGGTEKRENSDGGAPQAYTDLLHCKSLKALVGVTYDHNIILYSTEDFERMKQFVGYNDEVLDMRYVGEGGSLLAVATNSEQVKIFDRHSFDCQVLPGHSGIVLCLDASSDGKTLATSSKDSSIRVWRLDHSGCFHCVAMGTGHTHAVGAVALSRLRNSFVVSGSQDHTVKLWSLENLKEGNSPVRLPVKYTQLAHDKDINSLDVSPNDKLVVSGSQDKTAKLWQVSDGSLLGTFRGHRRGVWSVKFSPVDQCVVTASGDATVKLWAVADFGCVKTFEGHTNSVLKAIFLTRGMQIASSGSDGLIKLWTIKTNECVATLDQHTEKVWCLASSLDEKQLVSGGADSLICQWRDITEEVEEKEQADKEQLMLREQELSNLLQRRDFVRAVGLAITLDQPFRVLNILTELLDEGGIEGAFSETVLALREDQVCAILRYLSRWNMNAKHSRVAQTVLSLILKSYPPETIVKFDDIRHIIEGLIPYTERHFQRLSRLQQLSMFVDYTWQCMKLPGDWPQSTSTVEIPTRQKTMASVSAPADTTTPDGDPFTEDKEPDSTLYHHSDTEGHVTSTSGVTQEPEPKVKRTRKRRKQKEATSVEEDEDLDTIDQKVDVGQTAVIHSRKKLKRVKIMKAVRKTRYRKIRKKTK